MNILTQAQLLLHIVRWRLTWPIQNTRYAFRVEGNPKFMGPREAVEQCVKDGDCLAFSGLGGNQRASILYYALRDMFLETGHPRDLDAMAIGGIGGRSRIPGTVEELGHAGLLKRFFSGHLETFKSLLRLADQGELEIQVIPQGMMAFLLSAQATGEPSKAYYTGTGTFVDPRVGRGTNLMDPDGEQFVRVEDDKLRYRVPDITVAMFNAPAADREGNIYLRNCAMQAESWEIAKAARRNGGKVVITVGKIVEKGYDEIFLPADEVDAVVYWKWTEQTGGCWHRKPWSMFTTESDMPISEAIERVRFINKVLGITPRRRPSDFALARLAATVFAENVKKGSWVNIGVGLPEEVCRLVFDGGLTDYVTFFTESGVLGGLPAPGVFFGGAVCPEEIMSSAEIFRRCYEKLDVTVLGVLQADSQGNVNVSKRGEGAINYVGPGGFIDLTTAARMVIFVSTWMDRAEIRLEDGQIRIAKPGKIKFIDQVDEVTFNGQEALKHGKSVFYITNVGSFRLTARGMELINVMPGIDVRRDILDASSMKIVLPESGDVPVVSPSIVTGKGFQLELPKG